MVMQVLIFRHILAISLNNISRYVEDDISLLSSVKKRKGPVLSIRICTEILYLLEVGEVYILGYVSEIFFLLCLLVFSLKINPMPGDLFTITESLS